MQIELEGEMAQSTYANLTITIHSSSESMLDFVWVLPGSPKTEVQPRVILVSEHAKRLQRVLEENIVKHKRAFNLVRLQEEGTPPMLDMKGET